MVKKSFLKKLFSREIPSEERGQAESVFRLLIDSIIGLAILAIIVSMLVYFNGQVAEQSKKDLSDIVKFAASSPNGKVFVSKTPLSFTEGFSISASDAQGWTNISQNCFTIDAPTSPSTQLFGSPGKRLAFLQNLKATAYAKCDPKTDTSSCNPKIDADPHDCCIECIISIGREIKDTPQ